MLALSLEKFVVKAGEFIASYRISEYVRAAEASTRNQANCNVFGTEPEEQLLH